MKKVLILAYYFPPCNLAASQRVNYWALHLHKSGYYPIVVTRNWENEINKPNDIHKKSGNNIVHQKTEHCEIYYLPYKPNLRDRLYTKNKLPFIRKALSFTELFLQNFCTAILPYGNMFGFAKSLIKNDAEIKAVIASANPFTLFRFCYKLKKMTGIPWIADYRDDWNTSGIDKPAPWPLSAIERNNEVKWVSSASFITTISEFYAQKISRFVRKPVNVIYNGYSPEDYADILNTQLFPEFTITFNGSLYPTQKIEIFTEGFRLAQESLGDYRISLLFPGLAFGKVQEERVKALLTGCENNYTILPRSPRADVLKIQARSHVLLMVAHSGKRGISSSKLYEYLPFRKPVMLCPSDNDIIENTLRETRLGIICNTPEEVRDAIVSLVNRYRLNGVIATNPDETKIEKYSRLNQLKKMAGLLDIITQSNPQTPVNQDNNQV